MHASVPSTPSTDAAPAKDAAGDEDEPERAFRRLLEHAQRLGTGPAASDTSFKLYLHRIACGCGDANGGWPAAGTGFGDGSPFAGSFMGSSSAFHPPPGGSGGVSFPMGAGSSSLQGGALLPGTSGPASGAVDEFGPLGGGSSRRALEDLSGDALGLLVGDTGAGEGVSASDGAGSGPWAWVDPLLQCIHTLEVWAVTILGSTDVRGATAAIGKAEDSSRRLHRKAKVRPAAWDMGLRTPVATGRTSGGLAGVSVCTCMHEATVITCLCGWERTGRARGGLGLWGACWAMGACLRLQ